MAYEGYIDITGCDLIAFVKKAYSLSKPQGLGFLHAREGALSDADAKTIVENEGRNPARISMDYVHGRAVKMSIIQHEGKLLIAPRWYDHSQDQLRILLESMGKELPAEASAD